MSGLINGASIVDFLLGVTRLPLQRYIFEARLTLLVPPSLQLRQLKKKIHASEGNGWDTVYGVLSRKAGNFR